MSNRFFSPQPNVPGQGIVASYGLGFWALVVTIGLTAGAVGAVLMLLLHALEHFAWSYHSGTFLHGVQDVSAGHRVLNLLGAGILAGIGALALGKLRGSGGAEVSDALWLEEATWRLPRARGAVCSRS